MTGEITLRELAGLDVEEGEGGRGTVGGAGVLERSQPQMVRLGHQHKVLENPRGAQPLHERPGPVEDDVSSVDTLGKRGSHEGRDLAGEVVRGARRAVEHARESSHVALAGEF